MEKFLQCGRFQFPLSGHNARPLVMGILNVTPDSFSDGGLYFEPEKAVARAREMAAQGADILDIGGESTRPATFRLLTPLSAEEEKRRILPALTAIAAELPEMPISVDTYKAETAEAALGAGAVLINDISAFRADPLMARTVAEAGAAACLMHMPGLPSDLPEKPEYADVMQEVTQHLRERIEAAEQAGIDKKLLITDPGIGFGKTPAQNLQLLRKLDFLAALGCPVLAGVSRKSFIGHVLGGLPPEERLEGTAAAVAFSIFRGARMVRVHDVKEMVRTARMSDALL